MFLNGLDVNYAPLMEELGLKWITEEGRPLNDSDALLYFFRDKGVNCIRIRIWFGESWPSRLPYATELAKRAVEAGMWIQPTILLSDSWADLYKQPMPKLWKLLPLEEKVKTHAFLYIESCRRAETLGRELCLLPNRKRNRLWHMRYIRRQQLQEKT